MQGSFELDFVEKCLILKKDKIEIIGGFAKAHFYNQPCRTIDICHIMSYDCYPSDFYSYSHALYTNTKLILGDSIKSITMKIEDLALTIDINDEVKVRIFPVSDFYTIKEVMNNVLNISEMFRLHSSGCYEVVSEGMNKNVEMGNIHLHSTSRNLSAFHPESLEDKRFPVRRLTSFIILLTFMKIWVRRNKK